jgi:hypothetical protein
MFFEKLTLYQLLCSLAIVLPKKETLYHCVAKKGNIISSVGNQWLTAVQQAKIQRPLWIAAVTIAAVTRNNKNIIVDNNKNIIVDSQKQDKRA